MLPDDSRWRDLFSGKNAAISIALSFGVVIHAVNILMATTILPSVVADIGGLNLYAGIPHCLWRHPLSVLYSPPAACRIRCPYRLPYIGGGLFAGSLACALAPRMEIMLLGRTIQGFGGGVMFALSYAMINLVYVPALWPRAMALISGCGVLPHWSVRQSGVFCPVKRPAFCFWCDVAADGYLWALLLTIMPKSRKMTAPAVSSPDPADITDCRSAGGLRREPQPGCVPECGRRGGLAAVTDCARAD